MAYKKVTYSIDLEGNAKKKTQELGKETELLEGKTKRAQEIFARWASLSLGIDSILNIVNKATSAVSGLTEANKAQQEVEAKLSQAMRNTMGASNKQIESIKALTSAQQQLGVIGDEIQLAGAQELSTYLTKTDSLKKLLPAMNDMLAQQYGLNASQESAVTIASMMGKVMAGQVGALSRYGYTFDKNQEKILKFGTETQKAAVLTDVITSAVGGMNEKLAQTPEGKIQQQANAWGDIKERLGNLVVQIQVQFIPIINKIIERSNAIIDTVKNAVSFITNNMPLILGAGGAIGILVATQRINTSLIAMRTALGISGAGWITMAAMAKAACRSISTAIMNIPIIGWIAAGITVVIAVVQQLWNKCEGFRAFVMGVWEIIKSLFAYIGKHFLEVFNAVWGKIKNIISWIKGILTKAGAWFKRVMQPLKDWFSGLWDTIKNIFSRILGFMGKIFNPIIQLWNKLTGKAVSTYQTGAAKGRASFQADKKNNATTSLSTVGLGGGGGRAQTPTGIKQMMEDTVSGGTRNNIVTINLGKFFDNIVFNGTVEENTESILAQFQDCMYRTLASINGTLA